MTTIKQAVSSELGRGLSRRGFLTGLGALAAARLEAQARALTGRGTQLVLLGTQGGPNFNAMRNEFSNAVVVEGRTYLVDCGYGALGALREVGLNMREIGNVFLTHLHDDHTSDLAALLSHQWTDGRVSPTLVVGPYGTDQLVDAALAFAEANTQIRLADEDRSVLPADMFSARVIEATASPAEVFADDLVTVSSVENTHFSESAKQRFPYRSVSYRFDSRDRSVTISGDTAYSENLIRLAEGSDVFVCETIEVETTRRNFEQRVAAGSYADNPEGIWKHIVETHTSTEDAGRMAAAAGVGTLVLSHLVPGALTDVPDSLYLEGVRRHFDGEVIVGQDLMII
ncbi:MAG: MBL fold metallo-hydrolase [Gammaproteobacteria bacterium]|nr:MBL fold metallo-hydrolase [Gammaproteobacteria bacterium]